MEYVVFEQLETFYSIVLSYRNGWNKQYRLLLFLEKIHEMGGHNQVILG